MLNVADRGASGRLLNSGATRPCVTSNEWSGSGTRLEEEQLCRRLGQVVHVSRFGLSPMLCLPRAGHSQGRATLVLCSALQGAHWRPGPFRRDWK